MDLDVGRVDENGRMCIDVESIRRLRRLAADKPLCEKCFCQWTCAGGCHVTQSPPGCSEQYNAFCIQTRLITACGLVEDLGYPAVADALLADRSASEALAMHASDLLGAKEVRRD